MFSLFHSFEPSQTCRSVLVVVGNTVSWEDSWLDGGLAWLVGPLAFESVSLWWLWGSFLSAASGEISGADWLAVGGDPLIAGWKLCQVLKLNQTLSLKLDIISNGPRSIVSTNLSTVCCTFSITVHSSTLRKLWRSRSQLSIIWSLLLLLTISTNLCKPVSSCCKSTNLSALYLSTTSIWSIHTCAFWKLRKIKSIRFRIFKCFAFFFFCSLC